MSTHGSVKGNTLVAVVAAWVFVLSQLLSRNVVFSQDVASLSRDSLAQQLPAVDLSEPIEAINLGEKVNSELSEYTPRISADGKALYFCRKVRNEEAESEFRKRVGVSFEKFITLSEYERKRRIKRAASRMDFADRLLFLLTIKNVDGQEEVYVSRFENGEWTEAVNAGSPLNSDTGNEAPESISTDNNLLFVFKNGDIFTSKRIGTTWEELVRVEEPINSRWWDGDICFSSDGLTLFFVSKRPGFMTSEKDTAANHDIWVTTKVDSRWTEPINLGPVINTPKAERTPFLHADNRTLYFASDGHPGEGEMDIFKTTRLSDSSWTEWSEPVNLTRLNTPADDWDLTMPANSVWGYFSSEKAGGFGKKDIYRFKVDSTIAPLRSVTLISGVITSPSGEFLEAEIRWEDLDTGGLMGVATSNQATGEYTIALPAGHRYGYFATKENYWDKSENIDLTKLKDYKELRVDIELVPMPSMASQDTGSTTGGEIEIILNNIFFEFDQYELRKESFLELNRLAEKLMKHQVINIEIQGHTDDLGSPAYNATLSQRRADNVRKYLITQGVAPGRLSAVGYGENVPIDTNDTEEGRQNNRRVSFIVVDRFSEK